ncbi:MAG: DMT family transporter [Alphaproteobacteria bacterium]
MGLASGGDAPPRRRFNLDAIPNNVKGVLLVAAAAASAATMHNIIRYMTVDQGFHSFEVAFFRNAMGLIIFVPVLFRHGFSLFRTTRLPWHLGRSAVNATAMLCWFSALALIPVGDATAVSLIGPVFVAILAMIFLGEKVGVRRWVGILVAVAGAAVVVRPGVVDVNLGTWLVLISMVLVSGSKAIAKWLSQYDTPTTIVAYVTLLMTPITLVPALFVWQWPTLAQLPWLVAIGLLGTTGHLLFTNAYRLADVSLVDPASFMRMVWAALISYFVFDEFPDAYTWTGAAIIVIGTTWMATRGRSDRDVKRMPGQPVD